MTGHDHFTTRDGDMWIVTCLGCPRRVFTGNTAQLAADAWLEAHEEWM